MKSWILRTVASVALKNAIAYAFAVAVLTVDALRGVLEGDNLSEDHRQKLAAVLKAVISVRDFLGRMKELFGAPVLPVAYGSRAVNAKLEDAVTNLNRLTEEL